MRHVTCLVTCLVCLFLPDAASCMQFVCKCVSACGVCICVRACVRGVWECVCLRACECVCVCLCVVGGCPTLHWCVFVLFLNSGL